MFALGHSELLLLKLLLWASKASAITERQGLLRLVAPSPLSLSLSLSRSHTHTHVYSLFLSPPLSLLLCYSLQLKPLPTSLFCTHTFSHSPSFHVYYSVFFFYSYFYFCWGERKKAVADREKGIKSSAQVNACHKKARENSLSVSLSVSISLSYSLASALLATTILNFVFLLRVLAFF